MFILADFNEEFNRFTNTKDTTAEYAPEDIQNNKVMAILAYLSWLVLIPLIAAKDSKFARFHCNQGIVLAIIEIVIWAIFGALSFIPLVGWIFIIINSVLSLGCFALAVIGIINAANGKAKELPLIGHIKLLK